MKKVFKNIVFILLALLACKVTYVKALTDDSNNYYEYDYEYFNIDEKELNAKNSDGSYKYDGNYIIGTHMFTYEGSEKYDGILTTKHIMLAASTIGKYTTPTIDDMRVFYVDGNKLTDAFTGTEYDDFNIEIENINLKKVDLGYTDSEMNVPYLSIDSVKNVTDNSTGKAYDTLTLLFGKKNDIDFYKLFVSSSENGKYVPIDEKIENSIYKININSGNTKYFKVKACDVERKKCSNFSNIVSHTAKVNSLELYGNPVLDESGVLNVTSNVKANGVDGYELFSSTKKDSDYKQVQTGLTQKISEDGYYEVDYFADDPDNDYVISYVDEEDWDSSEYHDIPDCSYFSGIGMCYFYFPKYYSYRIKFDFKINKDEMKFYKIRGYVIDDTGVKRYGPMSSPECFFNPQTIDESLEVPHIEYVDTIYDYDNDIFLYSFSTDKKYNYVQVLIKDNEERYFDSYTDIIECNDGVFSISEYDLPPSYSITIKGVIDNNGVIKLTKDSNTVSGYTYDY